MLPVGLPGSGPPGELIRDLTVSLRGWPGHRRTAYQVSITDVSSDSRWMIASGSALA
jgi:hypothetical protein